MAARPPRCMAGSPSRTLFLGGKTRPAPPPPHAKRSGSNMPPTLRLGPTCSNGKKWLSPPTSAFRLPEIACRCPEPRWIGMTGLWLEAACSEVPGSYAWSGFRGRPGLICYRGGRAQLSPTATPKGHPRLRLRHRWDRARIRQASCACQRVGCVAPRPRARRLVAFCSLPDRH